MIEVVGVVIDQVSGGEVDKVVKLKFDYNYLITDLLRYARLVQRGLPTAIDKMHIFFRGAYAPRNNFKHFSG